MKKLVATIYSSQNGNLPSYSYNKEDENVNTTKKILTNNPPKDNNEFNSTFQKEKGRSNKQLSMQDPRKSQFLSQNIHQNNQEEIALEGGNEENKEKNSERYFNL